MCWFTVLFMMGKNREVKNICRLVEALPSGILSLSSQRGQCRTTRLQDYRVQEYRLPSPPLLDVMYYVRVSEDSQIFLALPTLKRKKSWVIFIYLWGK